MLSSKSYSDLKLSFTKQLFLFARKLAATRAAAAAVYGAMFAVPMPAR
jgi:hypothetical protein